MPRTKFTTFTVRTEILQGIGWATISEHLGFRSVGAWLASLAEERHSDFADAGYEAAQRKRSLYLLSEEEQREKPLSVTVRRAYRWELDRLYNLALADNARATAQCLRGLHGQDGVQPPAFRGIGP
jgi:hypothetical protein